MPIISWVSSLSRRALWCSAAHSDVNLALLSACLHEAFSAVSFLHLSGRVSTPLIQSLKKKLLVKWVAFLGTLHWPAGVQTLVLVVFPMLNYSFFMSFGLGRGCLGRRLILVTFVQDAQFQCRLFRLVQALIFGVHVVLLVLLCGLFACYLGSWGGLSPVPLVLITAGCVIVGGKSVVMVLLLGLVRVPLSLFKMSFWGSFSILGVLCLLALFLFGIVLLALLVKVPLGGYLHLVMLLVWLLLLMLGVSLLIVLRMRFLGLVVLVRDGRDCD